MSQRSEGVARDEDFVDCETRSSKTSTEDAVKEVTPGILERWQEDFLEESERAGP